MIVAASADQLPVRIQTPFWAATAKLRETRECETMVLGSHHSEEAKAKMSIGHTGLKASPEARAKQSIANMGRIQSLETCAKITAAKMGHLVSSETRAKIGAANTGRVRSPAVRARIGLSQKGRVFSIETRAKISAARKGKCGPDAACWKGGKTISVPKHNAKRRTLGFNPLNSWFVGCEGHHINPLDVIYMPEALHKSIYHNQYTGQGMAEMNALAGQFLTEDWT